MRPTRNETLMEVAKTIAKRGTCDRKQVGAVIAKDGRVIAMGYNGAPPGLPHCSENFHGWQERFDEAEKSCMRNDSMDEDEAHLWALNMVDLQLHNHGCRNATHAEANALAFAAKYGMSTDCASLYVTVSPCVVCARLLIAAGITAVYFVEPYRDANPALDLLEQAGVWLSHEG
jgi:dCMP deaminase